MTLSIRLFSAFVFAAALPLFAGAQSHKACTVKYEAELADINRVPTAQNSQRDQLEQRVSQQKRQCDRYKRGVEREQSNLDRCRKRAGPLNPMRCQQGAMRIQQVGAEYSACMMSYTALQAQLSGMPPEPDNQFSQIIEGHKGPRRKRLRMEAAQKEYRLCTELLPYQIQAGQACNGNVSTEKMKDEDGNIITRKYADRDGNIFEETFDVQMCYPYAPSVRQTNRIWNYEKQNAIKVAFLGGTDEMRREIQAIAEDWASGTRNPDEPRAGLHFDFGRDVNGQFKFNEWTTEDTEFAANIRISFDDRYGYWSMIGNESDDPEKIYPSEASMNLAGMGGTRPLPRTWKRTVYHEFGHALGLQHEHQHPESVCGTALRIENDEGYKLTRIPEKACETENGRKVCKNTGRMIVIEDHQGRKPGIVTFAKFPPNNWSEDDTRYNMEQLWNDGNMDTTAYDKHSVMQYPFPIEWYRDDAPEKCLPSGIVSERPSAGDREMINRTYKGLLQRKVP